MRVLLVSGVYPPAMGGPSAQTRSLARWLIGRGHQVRVLTTGDDEAHEREDFVQSIRVRGGAAGRLTRHRALYADIRAALRAWKPDVVHVQTCTDPLSFWTGLAANRLGLPALVKFSSDWYVEAVGLDAPWWRALPLRVAQRMTFRWFDRIWATTPAFAERARRLYGTPSQRVLVAPNPVGTLLDGEREDGRAAGGGQGLVQLLCVARLKPAKGIETLIDAIARLPRDLVRLKVVGEGDRAYRASLEERIRRLGLDDEVSLTGAVPPADIWAQYASTDVFISPSRYEPFGIVLLEAMRAALPVIATATDGARGIVVDRETGLLVPVGEPEPLAEAIRSVVADSALRRQMGRAGADRVRAWSEEDIFRILEHTYRALLLQRRYPNTQGGS